MNTVAPEVKEIPVRDANGLNAYCFWRTFESNFCAALIPEENSENSRDGYRTSCTPFRSDRNWAPCANAVFKITTANRSVFDLEFDKAEARGDC
jgi:hypothetical protein